MVPRCYGIKYFEKGLLTTKTTRLFLGVFEVFEKARGVPSRRTLIFLTVGVPRRVTKLFRIDEENLRCGEIQIGGNSFRKTWYFLGKSLFFYENHTISAKNTNFCEFCEKDARFQRKC